MKRKFGNLLQTIQHRLIGEYWRVHQSELYIRRLHGQQRFPERRVIGELEQHYRRRSAEKIDVAIDEGKAVDIIADKQDTKNKKQKKAKQDKQKKQALRLLK